MSQRHSPEQLKALLAPLRQALYDFDEASVLAALQQISAPEVRFKLGYPLGEFADFESYYQQAFAPLQQAWPDLERRDTIVMAGQTPEGDDWVGCCGYYTGTFMAPWLHIPPTGHQVAMRFHEFYRVQDGKVVEMQALWDIVEVMMQADAWPLGPSLGRQWQVPAPATQDGLQARPYNTEHSQASQQLVLDMLTNLSRHPAEGGPEVMQLDKYWHPKMNWYGPAGIGTARGIAGFRHWHQIPFLAAMPDRGQNSQGLSLHFFAEGDYVAVTGWPNMRQTLSCDGWLGMAPTGAVLELRSLDFWRVENGLIRENWVMVDLLDAWRQVGVDVFSRLREFNKARTMGRIQLADGINS